MLSESTQARSGPDILIYGPGDPSRLAERISMLLLRGDMKLVHAETREEIVGAAASSRLIFLVMEEIEDSMLALVEQIRSYDLAACDIVALMPDRAESRRMSLLACGFDDLITHSMVSDDSFPSYMLHLIDKGQAALEKRQQQNEYQTFQAALVASPDSFIVFDNDRKILFLSEHYRRLYPEISGRLVRGLSAADAYVLLAGEAGIGPEDEAWHRLDEFWMTMEGQVEYRNKDGRYLRMIAVRLESNKGHIISTTDITDYKRQELALAEKQRELEIALAREQEASAIQKQFIHMVSHEFRTPLSVIDGHVQILQRRAESLEPGDIRRRATVIRSAASRLVQLMEGVLSSSMLNTGRLELVPESFDLRRLLENLVSEHNSLTPDQQGDIITARIDLPPRVVADRRVLSLASSNLLSNAVKFSPDSPEITLDAWVENEKIYIRVEDNGMGVPENEQSRIFERFYRGAANVRIPGTGLGLNLTRDLVVLHGGEIALQSTWGEGSTFTIMLPQLDLAGGHKEGQST